MKHVILAGVTALALSSTASFAATSGSEAFTFEMNVPGACVLGAPAVTTNSNITVSGNTLTLLNTGGTNGGYAGDSIAITFGDSWCNASSSISLQSANQGLTSANSALIGATSDPLGTKIDYTAQVANWQQNPSLDTAAANNVTTNIVRAFRNDADAGTGGQSDPLTLNIVTAASTNPMLAGDYTDTLTMTIALNP